MTKRGRRRNSRRRRSSSSSKQSISAYIFQKQTNSNSVNYKDNLVEKGETDCLRKENAVSGSDSEERYNYSAPKEKKCKHDHHVSSSPNHSWIYSRAAEDRENGVKVVTSVSINDGEHFSPKIMVHQSREALSEDLPPSAAPGTNVVNICCTGSNVKLEIREILHANISGLKTVVYINQTDNDAGTCLSDKRETIWMPNNESFEHPSQMTIYDGNENKKNRFGCGRMSEPAETHSPAQRWENPSYCSCGRKQQIPAGLTWSPHDGPKSFGVDLGDIPPPQEFADTPDTLEDLTLDLASYWNSLADKSWKKEAVDAPEAVEKADVEPYFDLSDRYDYEFMRPSLSTNRSSFTKDFVNCQKRKSWIRSNSIATIEQRTYPSHNKRRQTFPGMSDGLGSMQDDLIVPYSDSVSSLILFSLHLQTERQQEASALLSESPSRQKGKQSFHKIIAKDNTDDVFADGPQCPQSSITYKPAGLKQQYMNLTLQSVSKEMEALATDRCEHEPYQSETADSGFHQEMRDIDYLSPEPLTQELGLEALSIQIIPPSCSGSREQIAESPVVLCRNATKEDWSCTAPTHRRSLVRMMSVGELEQRFTQMAPLGKCTAASEGYGQTPPPDTEPEALREKPPPLLMTEERNHLHLVAGGTGTEESHKVLVAQSCSAGGSAHQTEGQLRKSNEADKHSRSRSHSKTKEHLRPVIRKDPDGRQADSDHWGKRRKLFKETKHSSSAAGSSVNSDITEESASEVSLDVTFGDCKDRGFYTETFHSSAWIYQGDDVGPGPSAPSLSTRAPVISIRERTVEISKGSGEYPWGFRIQFSKPIVVTEVDTNGAAEEAGLMVGDYVLAVNGTDVTSVPHSEAAALARQGPDVLTLTVGSDIACCPNTPRPACRGYLHKRTHTGLIKGWRKRWFVLTHDCCLYYYRHKRDEGKRGAVSALKLEGAEVGQDASLGKPFVFKCRPQSAHRVYFFCATSNQEMKRWLEAMKKAIHPVTQNHVWVDVTRHNANLPPLAVKNPECLGLLHKMDKNKDMWLQYYCILMDGCLYLYSGIRATHAHAGIYLQGYVVREQPYGAKKSTIELKPPSDEFKTFYLCAENPKENQRWIVAIKASIKKWLPLHQAIQDYMSRPPEETRM